MESDTRDVANISADSPSPSDVDERSTYEAAETPSSPVIAAPEDGQAFARTLEEKQTEPSKPYTIFRRSQIVFVVAFASWAASFSGLSSNIYFPSISVIATDLNVTPELVNITVTLYLIFQGLSPSVWAPLSDIKGRRAVILITFTLYIGANIGLALTKNFAQLAVLRAVQSSGSASSVAIGAAIVGDVADRASRAGYMGIFGACSLLATALGPIIGGAMAETVGWRSIFWLLVAYAGAFLLIAIIFLPETLRSIVGNGEVIPKGMARTPMYRLWVRKQDRVYPKNDEERAAAQLISKTFHLRDIAKPILLLRHAKVLLSVLYLSLHYAVWQMSITASATLFARNYGLNELEIGLTFLANGGGCLIGTLAAGKFLDVTYAAAQRRQQRDKDEKPMEIARARLLNTWILSVVEAGSLILFGWTIDKHVHISAPIIATFFIAASLLGIQTAVTTFLVDSFPADSASANATLNLGRCWLAAGGTSAILPMTNAMGIGWAFTFLCFLLLASNALIVWQLHVEHRGIINRPAPPPGVER